MDVLFNNVQSEEIDIKTQPVVDNASLHSKIYLVRRLMLSYFRIMS